MSEEQADNAENGTIHREPIEWCDVWVTKCTGSDLPRALLIGDSITKSYYSTVNERLKDQYAFARLATSKCVGDPLLYKELDLVLSEYDFEVIHFNNGMHGWDYSEKEYAVGLKETMDWLLQAAPGRRIIWANTTPVREREELAKLNEERTARVRERNRIAAELARERGMEINDLFSVVVDRPELYCDAVHFTTEGQAALGNQAADIIAP